MLFSVVIAVKESADMNEVKRLSASESLVVWNMHKSGLMREIFHRADKPGVVCLMDSLDRASLEKELAKLPLKDVMTFEIIPLEPYKGYEQIWQTR